MLLLLQPGKRNNYSALLQPARASKMASELSSATHDMVAPGMEGLYQRCVFPGICPSCGRTTRKYQLGPQVYYKCDKSNGCVTRFFSPPVFLDPVHSKFPRDPSECTCFHSESDQHW
eukprot:g60071.t1